MRLRKIRLATPIIALNAKSTANCHAAGCSPRQKPDRMKLTKLAKFTQAASRERYRPRIAAGTSEVIHGNQAQLEMPRERLKANSSVNISTRRVDLSKTLSKGTTAIAKMNITRVPQPA